MLSIAMVICFTVFYYYLLFALPLSFLTMTPSGFLGLLGPWCFRRLLCKWTRWTLNKSIHQYISIHMRLASPRETRIYTFEQWTWLVRLKLILVSAIKTKKPHSSGHAPYRPVRDDGNKEATGPSELVTTIGPIALMTHRSLNKWLLWADRFTLDPIDYYEEGRRKSML